MFGICVQKIHSDTTDSTVRYTENFSSERFISNTLLERFRVPAFGKSHYNVANTLGPITKKDKIWYRDSVCVALNGRNNVTYQAGIIFKTD
jgi:hypothetical protein